MTLAGIDKSAGYAYGSNIDGDFVRFPRFSR